MGTAADEAPLVDKKAARGDDDLEEQGDSQEVQDESPSCCRRSLYLGILLGFLLAAPIFVASTGPAQKHKKIPEPSAAEIHDGPVAVDLQHREDPPVQKAETPEKIVAPEQAPTRTNASAPARVGAPGDGPIAVGLHGRSSKAPPPPSLADAADASRHCSFEYPKHGGAECYCQLAGNSACSEAPCACSHGCDGQTMWSSAEVASFKHPGPTDGCDGTAALVTVSRKYFQDVEFLTEWCPSHARALLKSMLEESFKQYQAHIQEGPVQQCIHAGSAAKTPWLHIVTTCQGGHIDTISKTNGASWCGLMTGTQDGAVMSEFIVDWALHGKELQTMRTFDTCAGIGCGSRAPAPLCSCDEGCGSTGRQACCRDFNATCAADAAAEIEEMP